MKRIGLALAGASLVLVLTSGCGSAKKLDCTISKEENGVSSTQVFTMNFNSKKKFESASLSQDMKLGKDMLDDFDTYKEAYKKQFESDNFKDWNPKVTDNGKDTITVKMDMDVKGLEKMSGGSASSVDYDTMKEQFEKNGYTCK